MSNKTTRDVCYDINEELQAENEALKKELTELKARSCEGCKHGEEFGRNSCPQQLGTESGGCYADVDYCSLWEKRDE